MARCISRAARHASMACVRFAVGMPPVRIDGQVAFVFELVARRDIARDEAAPALLALAAEEIACWVAATAQMTT